MLIFWGRNEDQGRQELLLGEVNSTQGSPEWSSGFVLRLQLPRDEIEDIFEPLGQLEGVVHHDAKLILWHLFDYKEKVICKNDWDEFLESIFNTFKFEKI